MGLLSSFLVTQLPENAGNSRPRLGLRAWGTTNSGGPDSIGARYYSSALGRFMTPDWSAAPEAVPYASLENPQSLNLHAYVQNNPVAATDPNGHWCVFGLGTTCTKKPKQPVKEQPAADPTGTDALSESMLSTAERESQGAARAIGFAQAHPGVVLAANIALAIATNGGSDELEGAAEGIEAAEEGARLPTEESQLGQIFRDAEGHLPDTPENRALLESVANDPADSLGTAANGTSWAARTLPDGRQAWVQTRAGRIVNGGINNTPRVFNPSTGLSGGGGL